MSLCQQAAEKQSKPVNPRCAVLISLGKFQASDKAGLAMVASIVTTVNALIICV